MITYQGPVPLYQQVKELIRREVESGRWQVDERIPSERELCEMYKLSRTTVRQAIGDAVNEGLLYRIQGKGTFVAKPKIDQELIRFTSFADTMRARGLSPAMTILSVITEPADVSIASLLNLGRHEDVVIIGLLGMGSGDPMVYYQSYLPQRLGLQVAEEASRRADAGSCFAPHEIVAEMRGIKKITAEQTFEAAQAQEEVARRLGIRKGAPVFITTSIFSGEDDRPFEYRRAIYRGDKYKFHVTRYYHFEK